MCKCFQNCLETCYWHLIEKRFCYDETIALYEVQEKEEKNNNYFDNMAFYDSVSVIAGRAVVTIDPLPEEKPIIQPPAPIVQQPRRLRWDNVETDKRIPENLSKSVPAIFETTAEPTKKEQPEEIPDPEESKDKEDKPKLETLKVENLEPEVEIRRKSLQERRNSKSLYIKIDHPKEIPIIRQQSMPKFYLDTPDDQATTSMFRTPSTTLTSPVPKSSGFVFDLYSVVQMEKERVQNMNNPTKMQRKESERTKTLLQFRDKIKLRRVKSSLGTPVNNLPHSHHHI